MVESRLLAGVLHEDDGGEHQVEITVRWTDDDLRLELSTGDVLTAGRGRFTNVAVWMRGAIDGAWKPPDGRRIRRLAVLADDDVTRVAAGDFSRSLAVPTEALHEVLAALQPGHEDAAHASALG